ncbi:Uncharacterised protein [Dorea longicatena]|nr:Uncharacterised protein [Dorea longicatena]
MNTIITIEPTLSMFLIVCPFLFLAGFCHRSSYFSDYSRKNNDACTDCHSADCCVFCTKQKAVP